MVVQALFKKLLLVINLEAELEDLCEYKATLVYTVSSRIIILYNGETLSQNQK